MTDKDIKDYCKNCDVEPPAMRFKCPECEHNPNNENNFAKDINAPHEEQIIINGVDVSECLFYQSNFEEDYDVKIKHFCSNWHNSCESVNNSNCYFKQLARKTQECEELKKGLDLYKTWYRAKHDDIKNYLGRCYNALEEIRKIIASKDVRTRPKLYDFEQDNKILDIISKVRMP